MGKGGGKCASREQYAASFRTPRVIPAPRPSSKASVKARLVIDTSQASTGEPPFSKGKEILYPPLASVRNEDDDIDTDVIFDQEHSDSGRRVQSASAPSSSDHRQVEDSVAMASQTASTSTPSQTHTAAPECYYNIKGLLAAKKSMKLVKADTENISSPSQEASKTLIGSPDHPVPILRTVERIRYVRRPDKAAQSVVPTSTYSASTIADGSAVDVRSTTEAADSKLDVSSAQGESFEVSSKALSVDSIAGGIIKLDKVPADEEDEHLRSMGSDQSDETETQSLNGDRGDYVLLGITESQSAAETTGGGSSKKAGILSMPRDLHSKKGVELFFPISKSALKEKESPRTEEEALVTSTLEPEALVIKEKSVLEAAPQEDMVVADVKEVVVAEESCSSDVSDSTENVVAMELDNDNDSLLREATHVEESVLPMEDTLILNEKGPMVEKELYPFEGVDERKAIEVEVAASVQDVVAPVEEVLNEKVEEPLTQVVKEDEEAPMLAFIETKDNRMAPKAFVEDVAPIIELKVANGVEAESSSPKVVAEEEVPVVQKDIELHLSCILSIEKEAPVEVEETKTTPALEPKSLVIQEKSLPLEEVIPAVEAKSITPEVAGEEEAPILQSKEVELPLFKQTIPSTEAGIEVGGTSTTCSRTQLEFTRRSEEVSVDVLSDDSNKQESTSGSLKKVSTIDDDALNLFQKYSKEFAEAAAQELKTARTLEKKWSQEVSVDIIFQDDPVEVEVDSVTEPETLVVDTTPCFASEKHSSTNLDPGNGILIIDYEAEPMKGVEIVEEEMPCDFGDKNESKKKEDRFKEIYKLEQSAMHSHDVERATAQSSSAFGPISASCIDVGGAVMEVMEVEKQSKGLISQPLGIEDPIAGTEWEMVPPDLMKTHGTQVGQKAVIVEEKPDHSHEWEMVTEELQALPTEVERASQENTVSTQVDIHGRACLAPEWEMVLPNSIVTHGTEVDDEKVMNQLSEEPVIESPVEWKSHHSNEWEMVIQELQVLLIEAEKGLENVMSTSAPDEDMDVSKCDLAPVSRKVDESTGWEMVMTHADHLVETPIPTASESLVLADAELTYEGSICLDFDQGHAKSTERVLSFNDWQNPATESDEATETHVEDVEIERTKVLAKLEEGFLESKELSQDVDAVEAKIKEHMIQGIWNLKYLKTRPVIMVKSRTIQQSTQLVKLKAPKVVGLSWPPAPLTFAEEEQDVDIDE